MLTVFGGNYWQSHRIHKVYQGEFYRVSEPEVKESGMVKQNNQLLVT